MDEGLKIKIQLNYRVYGPNPANHLERKFSFIKVNRPHQSTDKHLPKAFSRAGPMDSAQLHRNTFALQ